MPFTDVEQANITWNFAQYATVLAVAQRFQVGLWFWAID